MKNIILFSALPVESASNESISALIVHIIVMILAGIYGGIINYFLEIEKEQVKFRLSIWQTIIIGMGASFLIPLFLAMISSDLINLKQLEFSKILIFFGFCLIAAISSRRFILTISERILKEAREAKKMALQVEETIAEKEKQSEIDQEAISLVQKVLEDPDPDEGPIPIANLKDKITSGSVGVRANIFFVARKFRRDNYERHPGKIERLIPIFEALIESDPDEIYHRNYAQLGYILKDKPQKEYDRAKDALSKAIESRDRIGETGFTIYEFNRAICNIELDPDFKNKKPSSKEVKDLILNDLYKAFQTDRWKEIVQRDSQANRENPITSWLKLNKIDLKSLNLL